MAFSFLFGDNNVQVRLENGQKTQGEFIGTYMNHVHILLGGAAGYMGVIIAKENANASWKGVASSLGLALGGRIGFKTFFKPIKIDISGKTRE